MYRSGCIFHKEYLGHDGSLHGKYRHEYGGHYEVDDQVDADGLQYEDAALHPQILAFLGGHDVDEALQHEVHRVDDDVTHGQQGHEHGENCVHGVA